MMTLPYSVDLFGPGYVKTFEYIEKKTVFFCQPLFSEPQNNFMEKLEQF